MVLQSQIVQVLYAKRILKVGELYKLLVSPLTLSLKKLCNECNLYKIDLLDLNLLISKWDLIKYLYKISC